MPEAPAAVTQDGADPGRSAPSPTAADVPEPPPSAPPGPDWGRLPAACRPFRMLPAFVLPTCRAPSHCASTFRADGCGSPSMSGRTPLPANGDIRRRAASIGDAGAGGQNSLLRRRRRRRFGPNRPYRYQIELTAQPRMPSAEEPCQLPGFGSRSRGAGTHPRPGASTFQGHGTAPRHADGPPPAGGPATGRLDGLSAALRSDPRFQAIDWRGRC